jgi:hypothetical protein
MTTKPPLQKILQRILSDHILSDHKAFKLDLNKNNSKKHANSLKLYNTLLNDQWFIDEIKEDN